MTIGSGVAMLGRRDCSQDRMSRSRRTSENLTGLSLFFMDWHDVMIMKPMNACTFCMGYSVQLNGILFWQFVNWRKMKSI